MNPNTSMNRRIVFALAWPIILSNISTPMLGLVDTAVIGNLGDAGLLGAIAIGSMLFSFLFWGFGFLRMGTTGLVAQAKGAGDQQEVKAALYRALIAALVIGTVLLALQTPIARTAFALVEGSSNVETAAMQYFQIRIWAAPFNLVYLVCLGFLLAHQNTKAVLITQLMLNGINIILDVVFVIGFGWGVAGVAGATVIAEVITAVFALAWVMRHLHQDPDGISPNFERLKDLTELFRTFSVNADIMIRTLCLILAFAWFTNEGAKAGDVLLATNAILMQFVSFSAFFLDGYALAAESLVGQAVGQRQKILLNKTIRHCTELGLATALLLTLLFWGIGPFVIDLLTNVSEVRQVAREFLPWVIAAPIVSLWCYLLDGIFIGATRTAEMRNAMVASLIIYLMSWWILAPLLFNHGLWLSLMIYFISRAATLYYYLPSVRALIRS